MNMILLAFIAAAGMWVCLIGILAYPFRSRRWWAFVAVWCACLAVGAAALVIATSSI